MDEVYILYSCDAWHSTSSMEILAVFSTERRLWDYLRKMKSKRMITEDDYCDLFCGGQTQGRDMNYFIKTMTLNPLKP